LEKSKGFVNIAMVWEDEDSSTLQSFDGILKET